MIVAITGASVGVGRATAFALLAGIAGIGVASLLNGHER
jgi:hypothetical protein